MATSRSYLAALADMGERARARLTVPAANGIPGPGLAETLPLLRVARPPAPDGAWTLARCYSIEDVAKRARRRLPLAARAYLDSGGEGEYTLRRNRAAFDRLEFVPDMPAT